MPDALILATADIHPDVELVVTGDVQGMKLPASIALRQLP
jgi:hypothetical protein